MWYEWNTKAEFDFWHNALCDQLGYPLINFNQKTGLPDENAQQTTDYTIGYEVEGKWIAWVDSVYAKDLIETDLRIPKREFDETLAE
jgi:hypothetical protein